MLLALFVGVVLQGALAIYGLFRDRINLFYVGFRALLGFEGDLVRVFL